MLSFRCFVLFALMIASCGGCYGVNQDDLCVLEKPPAEFRNNAEPDNTTTEK